MILILGGTTEARLLAGRLAARHGVTLSLAGVTSSPVEQGVRTIRGGFGGAAGLARHLAAERVRLLIDATHPFAAAMPFNAAEAARRARVPLLALRRPEWRAAEGDDWRFAGTIDEAVEMLPKAPAADIFVAFGRKEAAALRRRPAHRYLIRTIEPVSPALLETLPQARTMLARGPFSLPDEIALFRREGIGLVLSKNAGGTASAAKIEAARHLGLPVVMVRRPPKPDADRLAESVAEAEAEAEEILQRSSSSSAS